MDIVFGRGFVIFCIQLAIFIPLERCVRLRRSSFPRPELATDVLHVFVSSQLTRFSALGLTFAFSYAVDATLAVRIVWDEVGVQPFWLQCLEAMLLVDVAAYWTHRWSHEWRWWWLLHSVHHSSRHLDFMSTARVHFLDQGLAKSLQYLPILLIGFDPETLWIIVTFGPFHDALTHANSRIGYGPFRWLYVSPHFHHWHHTLTPVDKNYASLFPFLDLLFGTACFPKTQWPTEYGINDPMPSSWLGQLLYPFRRSKGGEPASSPT